MNILVQVAQVMLGFVKIGQEVQRLDRKLSEGYEVLRDLMGRTDEGWDGIRKVADTLREDILSLFDHIREWAREEVDYR